MKRSPSLARLSRFGVLISLPKAPTSENPRSSATMTRKLGLLLIPVIGRHRIALSIPRNLTDFRELDRRSLDVASPSRVSLGCSVGQDQRRVIGVAHGVLPTEGYTAHCRLNTSPEKESIGVECNNDLSTPAGTIKAANR